MNAQTTKCVESYKLVLIGDCNVGKTAIVERISNCNYSDQYKPTIGTGHTYWSTTIDGHVVDVQIWDTAGEERFASLAPIYYKDAEAAMVVFSIDDPKSAKNVETWLERFRDTVPGDIPVTIICNKIDLEDKDIDLSLFAKENRCLYGRTSAKTGAGVNEAFTELVTKAMERKKSMVKKPEITLKEKKSGCC